MAISSLFDGPVYGRGVWDVGGSWALFWGALSLVCDLVFVGAVITNEPKANEGSVVGPYYEPKGFNLQ
ncbi:MAG TPA: hypothetical protein VII30_11165 [Gemmatimonadaceae bacterium]